MIELIIGFTITLISLIIGFNLGRNQTIITADTKRQINQIFSRVVPKNEVGPVERPTAQQNYYRDHPEEAVERDVMDDTLNILKNQ